MTAEYPFESHFFNNNGFKYHYLDEGSGHPVVMVHGNPSWSFFYRHLVEKLAAAGYRAIAPDHIGCGRSDKPAASDYPYILERRIADLDNFINHLDLKKLTLVVHDWGGMIGLSWALKHMDKIASFIIMNTSAFPLPQSKPFPWTIALARTPLLGDILVKGGNAFVRGATKYCVKKPMAKEIAAGYREPHDSWSHRVAVREFVRDIPLNPCDTSWHIVHETSKLMPHIMDVPALLLWGEKDFVFDKHFLAEWQKRLPDLECHTFPQAGHYLLEDAFAEIWPLIEKALAPFSISGEAT